MPVTATFAGIGQGATVGSEADVGFGGSGVGNLLGSGIVGRSDKHFTAYQEGHLFAIGRRRGRGGSAAEVEACHGIGVITGQIDFHLLRPAVGSLCVDFAVVSVAEGTLGLRKEAYGVSLEGGDRLSFLRVVQLHTPYVEAAAVAFAQEEDVAAIVGQNRIAVFAGAIGQVGVTSGGGIVAPDVAGDGRCMVLAPFVFKAFAVLVEEGTVGLWQEVNHFGRRGQYLFGTSACCGNGIKFGHGRGGEEGTRSRVLKGGVEVDFLAVGREGGGYFGSRVIGQSFGTSAVGGHYEYIHIAIAVAGKGDLLAVGRPYGR